MNIKTISVEVKKSYNYQTFTASEIIDLSDTDNIDEVRKEAMTRCRKAVVEQLRIEGWKE